jgi:hypothetical protein
MYLTQIKTPAHRPVAEVRPKAAITGIMAHLDVMKHLRSRARGRYRRCIRHPCCPVTRERYGLSSREVHLPASTFAATRDIVRAILQLLQTSREDEHGKGIEGI